MKKSRNIKEKVKEIKGKIKKGIHRRVVRYAPAALGVLTSWVPVNLANATGERSAVSKNNAALIVTPENDGIIRDNTYSKLALAASGNANAYRESIAQISIATESLTTNPKNPAAVATGNGYYGQHQFGASQNSGYMVKKYTAYALANGSEQFRDCIMQNLLTGTKDSKLRLVESFIKSADVYFDRGEPEKAYMPSNPAYQKLFNAMRISPAAFTKVHNDFPQEGFERQKNFIFEVYLNLMPRSLKQTIEKHPRINFEEIHPAVMGSVIAIAVKQGNGARFDNALSALERKSDHDFYHKAQAEEEKNFKLFGDELPPPMTVISRKGPIAPENIVAKGRASNKTLTIYDAKGNLTPEDIITEPGRRVAITKTARPKNAVSEYSIVTYDMSNRKIETNERINTREWLKEYCRGFSKVYLAAEPELDKIPTLDTYMEMSIILNKPQLYDIMQKTDYKNNIIQEGTSAQLTPDMFRNKAQDSKEITFADNIRTNKISRFRSKMQLFRQQQKDKKAARLISRFNNDKSHGC